MPPQTLEELAALPVRPVPGSLIPQEARQRSWARDVQDYVRHPFLLKQAIQWREEAMEHPSPKVASDLPQLEDALRRLRAVAAWLASAGRTIGVQS